MLRMYRFRTIYESIIGEGLLKANDPSALRAAGLDVTECAALISDTFAEMIFMRGRVHAAPHAGNIYIRAIGEGNIP